MPSTEESPGDAVLIEMFRGGDEKAFEELYHRYRGRLYAFLNNLVGPGEQLELSEVERLIAAAVANLPLELRETFCLRQQGVAFKEIAAMQNCSINTALSRMQYALRALRKALSGFDRGILSGKSE